MLKITIKYFARYRELLGIDSEILELAEAQSVAELIKQLQSRGELWRDTLSLDTESFDTESNDTSLLVSLNFELVKHNTLADLLLKDGDELAFYPPVTGG